MRFRQQNEEIESVVIMSSLAEDNLAVSQERQWADEEGGNIGRLWKSDRIARCLKTNLYMLDIFLLLAQWQFSDLYMS